jgi:hypothetical protein
MVMPKSTRSGCAQPLNNAPLSSTKPASVVAEGIDDEIDDTEVVVFVELEEKVNRVGATSATTILKLSLPEDSATFEEMVAPI